MLKKTFIIFLGILTSLITTGQVTIGADEPPVEGAILNLKQNNSSDANSTKGLLLPRVNLEDLHNLFPMFKPGDNKGNEDLTHTGLTVYNVNNCFSEGNGPYAWDGEKWNFLIQHNNPEVLSFKDQDGNPFFARKFGDAGIWMTQNLAAKTYDPIRDNPGEAIYTNIKIRYPNNDPQLTKDHLWMGVFYDFRTATNNASMTTVNNTNIYKQGICPHGWHVPSTQEWYNLETEIIKNTKEYTTLDNNYADNGIIQPTLSTGNNQQYGDAFRPALIDPCPMPERTDAIDGVSLRAWQGSFAVRMTGVMKDTNSNGIYEITDEYGTKAGFWVAYMPSEGNGRNRVFLNKSIHNNGGSINRYYSVRCKKNER